ncbi:hypothetical protein SESBI_41186 [Sesbania bispinosa]|nr:hypothetical protein SESBI_41186 [Sesbania bispinosa]
MELKQVRKEEKTSSSVGPESMQDSQRTPPNDGMQIIPYEQVLDVQPLSEKPPSPLLV